MQTGGCVVARAEENLTSTCSSRRRLAVSGPLETRHLLVFPAHHVRSGKLSKSVRGRPNCDHVIAVERSIDPYIETQDCPALPWVLHRRWRRCRGWGVSRSWRRRDQEPCSNRAQEDCPKLSCHDLAPWQP